MASVASDKAKNGYFMLIFDPDHEEALDNCICEKTMAIFGRGNGKNIKKYESQPDIKFLNIGTSKCISREHALLSWDKFNGCYNLKVLSKKGLYSMGQFYDRNKTISLPMNRATPIKCGISRFYFAPALPQ